MNASYASITSSGETVAAPSFPTSTPAAKFAMTAASVGVPPAARIEREIRRHRVAGADDVVDLARDGRHALDLAVRRHEHHAALAEREQQMLRRRDASNVAGQRFGMIEVDVGAERGFQLAAIRLEDRRAAIEEEVAVLRIDDDRDALGRAPPASRPR